MCDGIHNNINFRVKNGKTYLYIKNSKGLKIDPCGTPVCTIDKSYLVFANKQTAFYL